MKKLIAITLTTLLSTSAIAENNVYLKANLGLNNIKDVPYSSDTAKGDIKLQHIFPVAGLGVGYTLVDNFRTDVTLDYFGQLSHLVKAKSDIGVYNFNLETKISSLILSLYKTIPLTNTISVFGGYGVGVASIKDERNGYFDTDYGLMAMQPSYGKCVFRVANKLTAGIDYKLSDNVTGELTYNYYMLGKSKPRQYDNLSNIAQRNFKVHNVAFGIRVGL